MSDLDENIQIALDFELQRQRNLLAGDEAAVLASYREQTVFLPDSNAGDFWDERFKEEAASQLEQSNQFVAQFPMEAWRIKKVLQELNLSQSIVNLGVGAGRLEAKLLPKIKPSQYLGTDITQETLTKLRQHFPHFTFVQTTLLDLPIENASVDQVLLLEVLEHIKPQETLAVLAEIRRILKPEGRLFISVPLNEGLEEMLPENPNSHLRIYSPELLAFELKQVGLEVKQSFFASAFAKLFWPKHYLNQIFKLRHPNNCFMIAHKS